jgi:hypothetical protein
VDEGGELIAKSKKIVSRRAHRDAEFKTEEKIKHKDLSLTRQTDGGQAELEQAQS